MLDIFSALVIFVPIILPIAVGYNIHPIHLGIIFLANMQLGYFHPPGGYESVHRQFPFRQTGNDALSGRRYLSFLISAGCRFDNYLLAGAKPELNPALIDAEFRHNSQFDQLALARQVTASRFYGIIAPDLFCRLTRIDEILPARKHAIYYPRRM